MTAATLTDLSIADRHRAVSGAFAQLARGVVDWEVPTPVVEWTARDIVDHFVGWVPGMLIEGTPSLQLTPGPPVADDPAAAWDHFRRQLQAVLDDPDQAGLVHDHPMTGSRRLDETIDGFTTADIFMHTWDLARATGQDVEFDQEYAAELDAGMRQMGEAIRSSGQFGEEQPVPDGASAMDRLIAYIGRDPRWSPPRG